MPAGGNIGCGNAGCGNAVQVERSTEKRLEVEGRVISVTPANDGEEGALVTGKPAV